MTPSKRLRRERSDLEEEDVDGVMSPPIKRRSLTPENRTSGSACSTDRSTFSVDNMYQSVSVSIQNVSGFGYLNSAVNGLNGVYVRDTALTRADDGDLFAHREGRGWIFLSDSGRWTVSSHQHIHLLHGDSIDDAKNPWDVKLWSVIDSSGSLKRSACTVTLGGKDCAIEITKARDSNGQTHASSSIEWAENMRVKDLKKCLSFKNIDFSSIVEKAELIKLAKEHIDGLEEAKSILNKIEGGAPPRSASLSSASSSVTISAVRVKGLSNSTLRSPMDDDKASLISLVRSLGNDIVRKNDILIVKKSLKLVLIVLKNLRTLDENPNRGSINTSSGSFRTINASKGCLSLLRRIGFDQCTVKSDQERYVMEEKPKQLEEIIHVLEHVLSQTFDCTVFCDVCGKARRYEENEILDTSRWECKDLARIGTCDQADDEVLDIVESSKYVRMLEEIVENPRLTRRALARCDAQRTSEIVRANFVSFGTVVADGFAACVLQWIQRAQREELGELMEGIVSEDDHDSSTIAALQECGVVAPKCFGEYSAQDILKRLMGGNRWTGPPLTIEVIQRWQQKAREICEREPWAKLWSL